MSTARLLLKALNENDDKKTLAALKKGSNLDETDENGRSAKDLLANRLSTLSFLKNHGHLMTLLVGGKLTQPETELLNYCNEDNLSRKFTN